MNHERYTVNYLIYKRFSMKIEDLKDEGYSMNKILHGMDVVVTGTALAAAAVAVTAVAPFVSAVAVPVFASKAFIHWNEHRLLYNQTLTNLTREKFGRVPGQDYTRWDGKAINQANVNPTLAEKAHEAMGFYVHGAPGDLLLTSKGAADSPFRTKEDRLWLDREFIRKEKEGLLDIDLKMLRVFSKALIPIIGVIWVLFTELSIPKGIWALAEEFSIGGDTKMMKGCMACMMGDKVEASHWMWNRAINFHCESLDLRLGVSK